MSFMVQDEFRLYFEDTGGDKPVILFLHGAGGNHLSWWQQIPAFREEYRSLEISGRLDDPRIYQANQVAMP